MISPEAFNFEAARFLTENCAELKQHWNDPQNLFGAAFCINSAWDAAFQANMLQLLRAPGFDMSAGSTPLSLAEARLTFSVNMAVCSCPGAEDWSLVNTHKLLDLASYWLKPWVFRDRNRNSDITKAFEAVLRLGKVDTAYAIFQQALDNAR